MILLCKQPLLVSPRQRRRPNLQVSGLKQTTRTELQRQHTVQQDMLQQQLEEECTHYKKMKQLKQERQTVEGMREELRVIENEKTELRVAPAPGPAAKAA